MLLRGLCVDLRAERRKQCNGRYNSQNAERQAPTDEERPGNLFTGIGQFVEFDFGTATQHYSRYHRDRQRLPRPRRARLP